MHISRRAINQRVSRPSSDAMSHKVAGAIFNNNHDLAKMIRVVDYKKIISKRPLTTLVSFRKFDKYLTNVI